LRRGEEGETARRTFEASQIPGRMTTVESGASTRTDHGRHCL